MKLACKIWKFCTKSILYVGKEKAKPSTSLKETTTIGTTPRNHFDLENKIKTFESDPSIFQAKYIQHKENEETLRQREAKKMSKDKFLNDLLYLFRTRDY